MGQYTNKGLYNAYNKANKERDKLDFYATPPNEVKNILNTLNYNFNNCKILEPSAGGGHMSWAIKEYLKENNQNCELISTDIHRHEKAYDLDILTGNEYDYLADDYPIDEADWIIMNPPYAAIEPFVLRSFDIAKQGIIMLARLQFLEGSGRYETILNNNPPSDIYVYVDRIQCWKGGVEPTGSSAQAYAWFIWNGFHNKDTKVHWIRRAEN